MKGFSMNGFSTKTMCATALPEPSAWAMLATGPGDSARRAAGCDIE
jgi:hypothetical protein